MKALEEVETEDLANDAFNSHLKPGYGYMEQVEIDMFPRCDDNTFPENTSLKLWYNCLAEATNRALRPIAYNHETGALLEHTGFVDIREEIIRVPLNPWPTDPWQRDVGRWYNLGLTEGLEALTLGPFMRILGWTKDEVDILIERVKREVCTRRMHVYCNM